MDLTFALQLANTATFLGAFAFGVLQITEARHRRAEQNAIELVHSIQDAEFKRSHQIVDNLPDGATAEDFARGGKETENAAHSVGVAFEMLGYLVYQRIVPLRVADDLIGGAVRVSWRKLRRHAEAARARNGSANPYEWFQWLAERLEEIPAPGKREGAYLSHKKWKP
jgi:hypothetical protein